MATVELQFGALPLHVRTARLIAANPPFANQLWLSLRTTPWFDRLDAEGDRELVGQRGWG